MFHRGIASTVDRVTVHTAEHVNQELRMEMEKRLVHYARHPEQIDERLRELDEEWDIERAIEANASTLSLSGLVIGMTLDRRALVLPIVVMAFLFQHSVQGWCPPVPILRRMGFRTAHEIETERYALKILRGDFNDVKAAEGDGQESVDSWVARALRAIAR